jgi:glycosyltransferase involved in cell wall biosynthesis
MIGRPSVGDPLISVVMTTYRDDWSRLGRAIESVLSQTLADFEFLIIFEPGDDNENRVRLGYRDPRIVVIDMPETCGKSVCLNEGLQAARGRYIARMDGNDFCHPDRFEKEVAFLRDHADIALVGTACRLVSPGGKVIGKRCFPAEHAQIVRRMMFVIPFLQPSVMWDRERLGYDVRYDPDMRKVVEDAELWFRLLAGGAHFANLQEALVDYEPPPGYRRPVQNWAGNFRVRLRHWKIGLRYPSFFVGLMLFGALSIMPRPVIDLLTGRNWLSDRLRSIEVTRADT